MNNKLCFYYFCVDGNFFFEKMIDRFLIHCLKLLVSKKILIGFLFSTGLVKKTQKMSNGKKTDATQA